MVEEEEKTEDEGKGRGGGNLIGAEMVIIPVLLPCRERERTCVV